MFKVPAVGAASAATNHVADPPAETLFHLQVSSHVFLFVTVKPGCVHPSNPLASAGPSAPWHVLYCPILSSTDVCCFCAERFFFTLNKHSVCSELLFWVCWLAVPLLDLVCDVPRPTRLFEFMCAMCLMSSNSRTHRFLRSFSWCLARLSPRFSPSNAPEVELLFRCFAPAYTAVSSCTSQMYFL